VNKGRWQTWEIEAVTQLYPHVPGPELAAALSGSVNAVHSLAKRLGLRKSPEFYAGSSAGRISAGNQRGASRRFVKGHVPANKGTRRPGYAVGRMAETQFKKGTPASEKPNYKAVGSLRIVYGNLERKVTDDPSIYPAARWKPIHRLVWIAAHGPVPAGHIVVFKPGRHTIVEADITLDRIECISHQEQMRRNTIHKRVPEELRQIVQLRGALNRMINRRAKRHEEQDAGCPRPPDRTDGSDSGG